MSIFMLYPLACIFIPCIFYIVIQVFKFRRKTNAVHVVWTGIFIFYIYLVFEVTGIGTIWEIGLYPGMTFQEEINFIPFSDGLSMSMILNIIMFMPLGFLLPLLWKEYRTPGRVGVTAFFLSFGIELCQLLNRRVSDINDLMMNTLGAFLGWGIWLCFSRIFHLKYGRRNKGFGSKEAGIYLLLSLLGQFLFYNWRWMISLAQ